MSYDKMSAAAQRVALVAEGYRKTITVDKYEMRDAAANVGDIAGIAFDVADPARGILAFAVFVKAAKMARLRPSDVVAWLARVPGGAQAIADFAVADLDMIHSLRHVA